MKKGSLIIAVIAIAIIAVVVVNITGLATFVTFGGTHKGCADSDGGKIYLEKGIATYENRPEKFTDECVGPRELREYYCASDTHLDSVRYICDNGCVDGACVE